MPRRDTHDYFERGITGKLTKMSEAMDSYSPILHSHHREKFHSIEEVTVLAHQMADDNHSFEDNLVAGLIHLAVDEAFDTQSSVEQSPQNTSKIKKAARKWQKKATVKKTSS